MEEVRLLIVRISTASWRSCCCLMRSTHTLFKGGARTIVSKYSWRVVKLMMSSDCPKVNNRSVNVSKDCLKVHSAGICGLKLKRSSTSAYDCAASVHMPLSTNPCNTSGPTKPAGCDEDFVLRRNFDQSPPDTEMNVFIGSRTEFETVRQGAPNILCLFQRRRSSRFTKDLSETRIRYLWQKHHKMPNKVNRTHDHNDAPDSEDF